MKELDKFCHNYGKVLAIDYLLNLLEEPQNRILSELNQLIERSISQYLKVNHPTVDKKMKYLEHNNSNLSILFEGYLDPSQLSLLSHYFEGLTHDFNKHLANLSNLIKRVPRGNLEGSPSKSLSRNKSSIFKMETGSKAPSKELPRNRTVSQLRNNDSFGYEKSKGNNIKLSKKPKILESSNDSSDSDSRSVEEHNSLMEELNPSNVFRSTQKALKHSASAMALKKSQNLAHSKSVSRINKPKVPSLNFEFATKSSDQWSQLGPKDLKALLKLKIQKMSLANWKEHSAKMGAYSFLKSFGMIKDNYYFYLGGGMSKLGVVNHNEKTNKWKLCHMAFVPSCELAEFCKGQKYFICAVKNEKYSKVRDIRTYKDGKSYRIDFGNLTDHLDKSGMNLNLGFRNRFEMTLFSTNNNLIILLFNLNSTGYYDKIIKLSNKFIKESIADVQILSRSSFIVLGSKGYVGLYRKKYQHDTQALDQYENFVPSSFIDQEMFTFKIESQLDIKMTSECMALCMDVTLDQNFITIVVYSAKKKSYLLLIINIKGNKNLAYLTHLNLNIEKDSKRVFRINSKKRIGGIDIVTIFTNDRVKYLGIFQGKIFNIGERQANLGNIVHVRNITGERIVAVNRKFEMFTLAYKKKPPSIIGTVH